MKEKPRGSPNPTSRDRSGVGITFLSNLENGKQTAELGKTLNVLCNARIRPSQKEEAMSDL